MQRIKSITKHLCSKFIYNICIFFSSMIPQNFQKTKTWQNTIVVFRIYAFCQVFVNQQFYQTSSPCQLLFWLAILFSFQQWFFLNFPPIFANKIPTLNTIAHREISLIFFPHFQILYQIETLV